MPDVFHTADHHKHSRRWTLTGSWGSECVVCLVLLLDSEQSPLSKKRTLLKELNTLLRSSAELVALLSDCELVSRMQSSLLNALCVTQDHTAIESITALISKLKCNTHGHEKKLLDSTMRRFYKSSSYPKLAKLLSELMLQLSTLRPYLRDGLVCGSFVGNLCDTLRPSTEPYQDVILHLLYEINSITPLHSLITEVRLTALLETTISFLSTVLLQPAATALLAALLPSVDRHRNRVFKSMGKSLVLGMRHALLSTKVPTVQDRALTILVDIGHKNPDLLAQCDIIDHILECLTSVDEEVCVSALTLAQLCLASSTTAKSCEAYVVDAIINLINREKGQGRGRLVEECFNVLLLLPTPHLPVTLTAALVDILKWCDGSLAARVLVTCLRHTALFAAPRTAMVMLLALEVWTQSNLSQRTLKVSVNKWLNKVQEYCSEGEQVLALLLSVERLLFTSIITMCQDQHGHLDILQDLVTMCQVHCIQIVFSLDTKETCPHVYQHLFEIVMICSSRCDELSDYIRSNTSSPSFGDKFIARTLKLSPGLFDIRTVLCSAYKDPAVLATLHRFTWHVLYLGTKDCVPQQGLQEIVQQGLEVLPFVSLDEAFTDCMTSSERLTFRTSLVSQPGVCAKVTCLLAMLVGSRTAGVQLTITEVPLLQFIGMCSNNRTLPPFFLPLVLQLLASLPRTGHSLQPLVMAVNTAAETQADMDCSTLDNVTLRFALSLTDVHPLFKAACARALLNKETASTDTELSAGLGQDVVSALVQAFLDHETPDRLFLLDGLVAQCTDERVLEKVVLFVNRLFLHPNIKPDTTHHLIKVLCTVCYTGLVNSSLVRFVSTLQERVICRGENSGHALQLIYLVYTNNTDTVASLLRQRYDFLSSLVCNIDIPSSHPALLYSLLILLQLSRDMTELGPTLCLDLSKVLLVLDRCSNPLCLSALWLLLKQWVTATAPLVDVVKDLAPVGPSTTYGLVQIALQSVCDLHPLLSACTASFITAASLHLDTIQPVLGRSRWHMFSITSSLAWFTKGLPSGILILLYHLSDEDTRQIIKATEGRVFDKAALSINSSVVERISAARLLVRLTHLQPSLLTPSHRAELALLSVDNTEEWNKESSELVYHSTSLSLYGVTQCKAVVKELAMLCEKEEEEEMED